MNVDIALTIMWYDILCKAGNHVVDDPHVCSITATSCPGNRRDQALGTLDAQEVCDYITFVQNFVILL